MHLALLARGDSTSVLYIYKIRDYSVSAFYRAGAYFSIFIYPGLELTPVSLSIQSWNLLQYLYLSRVGTYSSFFIYPELELTPVSLSIQSWNLLQFLYLSRVGTNSCGILTLIQVWNIQNPSFFILKKGFTDL